ncbi:MAG TPA: TonB-dependent receptor [Hyphomonadaceae bacterium]|nr:TonB-dependent receptor [Hyphomonadaceae bacterium]
MKMWKKLAGGVAFVAVSAALTPVAFAQVTTSGVSGTVSKADGSPASDATVVVEDTRTGLTRTVVTTPTGAFDVRGLNVGGPYTVSVSAPGEQPTQVTDIFLNLGAPTDVNLAFSGATQGDVVVVTASQVGATPIAIGPSSVFSVEDLEEKPAINRDIKDIIRQDPRIYLDQTAGGPVGTDGVQCGGSSPRFNSVTVDGIGLNDGFGLNNNGYPTERLPFPFDAVNQVSVELAPFDTQYGGFTGCTINMVSKSGTNEFHGSAFFDYTDDSLRGDSIEGRNVFVPSFDEKRYGFTIGGPIIPDRLFFFGAYERFEGVNLFGRGPEGSGATTIVTGFTQAMYDQIVNTARDVYGIDDLGGTPTSDPAIDEKYLARLDWNINDRHRAALTYNYNKGLNLTESDTGSSNFEFGGHLYDRGAELKAYSGQLFSDWTDSLSTELRVSYNDVDATAECRDGRVIGEVRVQVAAGRNVYFGCDDSRHFNDLNYTVLTIKAAANYRLGDHTFSLGGERQTYDIFNAFTQHTEGEFVFTDNVNGTAMANFIAGRPSNIFYGNARGTNNPDDTAARFEYDINTVYLQDEFAVGDNADVTLGLRYDWYTNSDLPNFNANFLARNGFSNQENLDGKGILQPRFGFNWDVTDALTLRGGAGLFAGGNPNVWVSNSYSNDGVTAIQLEYRNPLGGGLPLAPNILTSPNSSSERPGGQAINPNNALWGVPTVMFDAVANASANSAVAAIDPDFQPASEWKFSIGATYDADFGNLPLGLGGEYQFDVDLIRGISNNAATITNATLARVGTAPDGSPLYKRIDRTDPDCLVQATINTAACTTRTSDDLLLTNSRNGGEATIFSASVIKSYDWGLDWSLGFAHVDAKDTRSMTSSVAGSNFGSIAVRDINNPDQARSNFNIPNRITMSVSYEHEWFEDFTTRISLFGEELQSRPYSYTFISGGNNDTWGDNNEGLHLLYVPNGPTDPNVVFCSNTTAADDAVCGGAATNFATAAFFDWADSAGLARGAQTTRNDFDGGWNNKFDLKIEQEFPTGFGKGSAFVVVENIGNLLNDDWGVFYEAPFPQRNGVVEIDRDAATNRFVYRRLAAPNIDDAVDGVSFWTVKVGATWGF